MSHRNWPHWELVERAFGSEQAQEIDDITLLEWLAASRNLEQTTEATRASASHRFARAINEATGAAREHPVSQRDHAFAQLLFLDDEAKALATRALSQEKPIEAVARLSYCRDDVVTSAWASIKHPVVVEAARKQIIALLNTAPTRLKQR